MNFSGLSCAFWWQPMWVRILVGERNFGISKVSYLRGCNKGGGWGRMHHSLSQALSLGFQRTIASTEVKVSSLWTLCCVSQELLGVPAPTWQSTQLLPVDWKQQEKQELWLGPWQVGCLCLRFFWTWHVLLLSTPGRLGASCSIRGSPDGREGGEKREYKLQGECWEGKKEERKEGRKEWARGNDGRKREAGKGKRVSKHWRGKTKRQKIE